MPGHQPACSCRFGRQPSPGRSAARSFLSDLNPTNHGAGWTAPPFEPPCRCAKEGTPMDQDDLVTADATAAHAERKREHQPTAVQDDTRARTKSGTTAPRLAPNSGNYVSDACPDSTAIKAHRLHRGHQRLGDRATRAGAGWAEQHQAWDRPAERPREPNAAETKEHTRKTARPEGAGDLVSFSTGPAGGHTLGRRQQRCRPIPPVPPGRGRGATPGFEGTLWTTPAAGDRTASGVVGPDPFQKPRRRGPLKSGRDHFDPDAALGPTPFRR